MMTMLEDLRLALRQLCGVVGLSGNAATVASLVVLGVALNLVALNAVESVRVRKHLGHGTATLRQAARTELKVMRTVVVSTLKKIGNGQRGWCFAERWETDEQPGSTTYHLEAGIVRAVLAGSKGCDAMTA
jgi:hypothetical protein